MGHYLIPYLVSVPLFLIIDLLWLGVVARDFYREQIGTLLLEQFNWPAAFLFYGLFLVGLTLFAIHPALKSGALMTALVYGALFGFFTYATYDLTNLATLKGWTVPLAVVDIAWGTFLGGAVSTGTYMIVKHFF